MILSILINPFTENYNHTYNIITYLSLIFSGYGMFLLAKHLTKNYFAAIVAGIIFTFSTYQTLHTIHGHIELLVLQFIPLSVLFLFKTVESNKIRYPIIGGIFLFLNFISTLYIGFFSIIFLIPIILYLILTKRKFQTLIRIGILLIIGVSLAAPVYYGHYLANAGNMATGMTLENFDTLSADLANFVLPTVDHTLTKIIDFPYETSFGFLEGWTFLGYTAIFLVILALLKTDKKEKTIWIIPGCLLAIISLGPFLKIGGIETGIHLPYYYLYDLPTFDFWRSIGRAAIFTTFCVAILAAYGINEIYKVKSFSIRKKHVIVGIIGILVIIEALMIPLPNHSKPESQIFYEIESDPRENVVLHSPFGTGAEPITDRKLTSNFFSEQAIHEKPIYLGYQARVSNDIRDYVRTYFLNQFIADQSSKDIIKQDLKEVGISLFDYFDIGYVIVHTDYTRTFPDWKNPNVKKIWMPQTKSTLMEIFSKPPDFEDDRLYAYKIPEPSSDTPFIVLGDGWSMFKNDVRKIGEESDIKIINPTNELTELTLDIRLKTFVESELKIQFNGKEISDALLENSAYRIIIPLELNPNENKLTLSFNQSPQLNLENSGATSSGDIVQIIRKVQVSEISINSESKQFLVEKLG